MIIHNLWQVAKRGLLQVLTANVMNKIVAAASHMVITRLLTRADFGIWSYVLNIYSYAALISGAGLASGAFQFGAEHQGKGTAYRYYKYCICVGFLANIGIIILVCLYASAARIPFENAGLLIKAYVPILLLEYLMEIFLTTLRCRNRISEYAKMTNIYTVLIAIGTCAGALFRLAGVIIGKYCAVVVALAIFLYFERADLKKIRAAGVLHREEKYQLWHYTLFTGVSSALNRSLYYIDLTMIAALRKNVEDIAVYKVSTMLPHALMFIPSSVVITFLPSVIMHSQDNLWLKRHVKTIILYMMILDFALLAAIVLFAEPIVVVLSGPQYADAAGLLRVHMIGFFLAGTFRDLSVNILSGLKKVHQNLKISLVQIFAEIILNYLCIVHLGIYGAAYATVAVEGIAALLSAWYLYRSMK